VAARVLSALELTPAMAWPSPAVMPRIAWLPLVALGIVPLRALAGPAIGALAVSLAKRVAVAPA
jgi:hypothetical protein